MASDGTWQLSSPVVSPSSPSLTPGLFDDEETPSPPNDTFRLPMNPYTVKAIQLEAALKPSTAASDYLEALNQHYIYLSDIVHGTEHKAEESFAYWRNILSWVFMSIPKAILCAAIDGSLPYEYMSEKEDGIAEYFEPQHPWAMQAANPTAPAIYGRFLVGEDGRSPSANEFMVVVKALREYASGGHLENALLIDNVFAEISTLEDLRNFNHHHLKRNETRVRQLHEWCFAVERKCKEVPGHERALPYPKPLTYCGYSRVSDYEQRTNTTWLVLLVEAAFKACLPDKKYSFATYALCFLASKEEAALSERAFTAILQTKVHQGGFCVKGAGQCSSADLRELDETEKKAEWEKLTQGRWDATPIGENLAKENEKFREEEKNQELEAFAALAESEAQNGSENGSIYLLAARILKTKTEQDKAAQLAGRNDP